jgi:septal ring factor EnvC (AmiA/AmiB activator)
MMQSNMDHRTPSRMQWLGHVLLAALIGMVFLFPVSTVNANFFDTINNIYNLPKDVGNLQKQYEETKKSYDETKQQVEEQKQMLLEATRKAQETEDRLIAQNKELQAHNEALQTRVQAMMEAVSSKDKWIYRIKATGITLMVLLVLYLVMGRVFRVMIWRRNNKRVR